MFQGMCCFEYSHYISISLSDDNIYFKQVHFSKILCPCYLSQPASVLFYFFCFVFNSVSHSSNSLFISHVGVVSCS